MAKSFTTANGTILPLRNMRGSDYLDVKYRIVWFREDHPTWRIETEPVQLTDALAIFKAIIRDDRGEIRAVSHKSETLEGFQDYIEKAETGAIGRALALCGFGTQFAPDLEEGERIVDSPAQTKKVTKPTLAKTDGVISEAQRKRLFAIAKDVPDAEMKKLLKEYGYESSKDINWTDYDMICNRVMSITKAAV